MKIRFYAAASALTLALTSVPAAAQHAGHEGMTMPMPDQPEPEKEPVAKKAVTEPAPATPMDHSAMGHAAQAEGVHEGHESMTGAFGPYPMTRESSGTAWQPDTSEHMGLMSGSGDWTLMGHGVLNLVFDHPVRPQGRRQDVRLGNADGHGSPAARRRHASIQGDGQSRPADGQERLSAAARQRRNGKRGRPSHRPPASA